MDCGQFKTSTVENKAAAICNGFSCLSLEPFVGPMRKMKKPNVVIKMSIKKIHRVSLYLHANMIFLTCSLQVCCVHYQVLLSDWRKQIVMQIILLNIVKYCLLGVFVMLFLF